MGLKLTPKFKVTDLLKQVKDDIDRIENDILERFQMVGDEFVAMARSQPKPPGFGDVTGNLRSSIGYIVFRDGKPAFDDFSGETEEGKQQGYDVAMEFEDLPQSGFCLVVVAGMEYAAAVESKGYDVISGSSLHAEKLLKESLERLKKKL